MVDPEKHLMFVLSGKVQEQWTEEKVDKFLASKSTISSSFATMIRNGVPEKLKGKIYSKLLKVDDDLGAVGDGSNYKTALTRTYGTLIPESPLPPDFGGRSNKKALSLNKDGSLLADYILCILCHDFPTLEFCPLLPIITKLLCHHMESAEHVLSALNHIIRQAMDATRKYNESITKKPGYKEWAYFPTSRKDSKLFSRAFGNLLYRQNAKLHQHIATLQAALPEPVWSQWLTNFYMDLLPQEFALFRIGVALFLLEKKAIMKCTTIEQVLDLVGKVPSTHGELLFSTAWGIKVNAADVRSLVQSHVSLLGVSQSEDLHETKLRYQRGLPKIKLVQEAGSATSDAPPPTPIMKDEYWIAMWSWIPPKLRLEDLGLVFTTKEHGYSMTSLFRLSRGRKPMILVIETSDSIFGAFLPEAWPEMDSARGQFYGTGECFLFTLSPYAKLYPWVGRDLEDVDSSADPEDLAERAERRIEIERTASFFVMTTRKEITIGGGGGKFGIWLDEDLHRGTTETCLTFNNDPYFYIILFGVSRSRDWKANLLLGVEFFHGFHC
ncbi:TLD-domain-containing protein [Chytridium lagenaria]|nr:TLD-domain-containing protein [Chytridium lagenaria]